MNEQRSNESEIIDAEIAEVEPPRRRGGAALALALLALLGVAAGLGAGYYYWRDASATLRGLEQAVAAAVDTQARLRQQLDASREAVDAQRAQLGAQQELIDQFKGRLERDREALARQNRVVQGALAVVRQRIGGNENDWMATEAEYLLRVAGHRLALEGDVASAIEALTAADRRLAETGDPGWSDVREAIATELTALRGYAPADTAGLAARLAGLANGVDRLVLGAELIQPPRRTLAATPVAERTLQTLFEDSLEGLKSMLVVRRRDQPVEALLAPDQSYFLYENLRLKLEGARLALLRRDAKLYRGGVETARQWLKRYFDSTDAGVQDYLAQLDALAGAPVVARPPPIGEALRRLAERRRALATTAEGER